MIDLPACAGNLLHKLWNFVFGPDGKFVGVVVCAAGKVRRHIFDFQFYLHTGMYSAAERFESALCYQPAFSADSLRIMEWTFCALSGSSPEVGSSKNRICGW